MQEIFIKIKTVSNFMENLKESMFGKGVPERKKSGAATAALVVYVILAVLYFMPLDIPYKISFPVAVLAAVSLWIIPWQMSLALVSSALGDFCGAAGNFMGQIEFFALAHLFLILFFVQRCFHDGRAVVRAGGKRPETRRWRLVAISVFTAAVLAFAMSFIVPAAPEGAVRGCVALYAVIICIMLFCALVRHSRVYAAAAVCFVFSDAVIAWNAFVAPVPGERYLIMVPYYSAQLMFFLRAAHLRGRGTACGISSGTSLPAS